MVLSNLFKVASHKVNFDDVNHDAVEPEAENDTTTERAMEEKTRLLANHDHAVQFDFFAKKKCRVHKIYHTVYYHCHDLN